MNKI
jgi:hypothetical protein